VKIIFVEFLWQVEEILKDKEKFRNDVIISLDQETSYFLMRNKIKYFETYEFCNHEQLWARYQDITKQSLKIAKVLDNTLWVVDERFKKLKWNLFDSYHYSLKIVYDQLYYYSELIYQVVEKYNPTEIWTADSSSVKIDFNCLIPHNVSILKFLLIGIEDKNKKFKLNYMKCAREKKNQQITFDKLNEIKSRFKNFIYKFHFLFNYYLSKSKYISIGCEEIRLFNKLYPEDSNKFILFRHENLNDKKLKKQWNLFKKFLNVLKNKTNFGKLATHRDISFELIFKQLLIKLTSRLDFFINEYNNSKKIVKKLKPSSIIFQTMVPQYSANIVFRKICEDLKIPFATWIHGGTGLTNSLLHYDVTDFRLSKNIISWGVHLEELFKDNKCTLNQLNLHKDIEVFPIGSMRYDYNYKKYFLTKKTKKNSKPIITYVAGSFQQKNQFYFGYNRKQAESFWLTDYEILKLLIKYQDKYKIIFKDYPRIGNPNLWKQVLNDLNASNISYIYDEKKLNTLLSTSDLIILPYMSTTFFDSLNSDADIFVVEEDIFEKPFKELLKNEIFYFKDNKQLKIQLEKYLEEGKFYKRNKKNSRNYFLNFSQKNNRNKLLNETLNNISNNY